MTDIKIKVQDVKEFIKGSQLCFASSSGEVNKSFSISLRSGPNVPRYIVQKEGYEKKFIRVGEAVKFYNEK